MDFSITSTKRAQAGVVLADLMIGSGLAALVILIIMLLVAYGGRSFSAMVNYVSLDQDSRNALDRMSKEIRQCNRLTGASTNFLQFEDSDGSALLYYYDPGARTLTRSKGGVADARPLLKQCDYLKFSIYQRNPIMGTYDQYPAADTNTCKLVQLDWICSRPIIGTTKNTESVQSAKVVIRKE